MTLLPFGKAEQTPHSRTTAANDRVRMPIRSPPRGDLPEWPRSIDNPDRDDGERHDHPILHWKASRDISCEPVRHRALQAGDYDSKLTQTLRGDRSANVPRSSALRVQPPASSRAE